MDGLTWPSSPTNRQVQQAVEPVLFGCRHWFLEQHHVLRARVAGWNPRDLHLVDVSLPEPVEPGQATAVGGTASFAWLTAACRAVLAGHCQALLAGRLVMCTRGRSSAWTD